MSTTAMYLRLSSEDTDLKYSDKEESNSITNQRSLLESFIRHTPELSETNLVEFCDDGWSGKNFERPAFQNMIEQVKKRKIQCIVVKDLLRFGRDYLIVGNYISCLFPFLGVRLIAVNDGFDSIRPADVDSLETSFKTLLYDFYSRDLSRNVQNAKRLRAQRGDFLSPFAPYGYIKDPNHKSRLIIDPEAAEIVRRIFRLQTEGKKPEQIARILNRDTIPSCMLYKRAAGCSRTRWPSIWEDNFWTVSSINMIIRDERYTGKTLYGKHTRDIIGRAHTVGVDRADWVVVENTHEGIVTQEEFDRAQSMIRSLTAYTGPKNNDHPLCGKVRCGVCRYAMSRIKGKQVYFQCRTPNVNAAFTCTSRIPERDILYAVSDGLHMQAQMAVDLRRLWEEQNREQKKDADKMAESLSELRETKRRLSQQISDMYESFVMGEFSKTEYLAARAAAVRQRDDADTKIAKIEAALQNTDNNGRLENGFVSAFEKYIEAGNLTHEILTEVLKEVRVYPDGRLEIVWNFRDELDKLVF